MKNFICLLMLIGIVSCSSSDVNEFKLGTAEKIAASAEEVSVSDFDEYLEPEFVESEGCYDQAKEAKVKIEAKLIKLFDAQGRSFQSMSVQNKSIIGDVCSSLAKIAIPYGVSKLEVSSCYKKLIEVRSLDLIADKACSRIDL